MTIHDCVREAYRRLGLTPEQIDAEVAGKDAQSEVAGKLARAERVPDDQAEDFIQRLMRLYNLADKDAAVVIKAMTRRVAGYHQNN
jgi:hypothetical protein